jgi:alkyl hydroperoxide reductase subunit AhpC
LQNVYKGIQAEDAEVLFITSDARPADFKTGFPKLLDPKTKAIAAYNVADPRNRKIARPLYYIVDENGVIRWKFVDVRLAGRLDPAKLVDALKKL